MISLLYSVTSTTTCLTLVCLHVIQTDTQYTPPGTHIVSVPGYNNLHYVPSPESVGPVFNVCSIVFTSTLDLDTYIVCTVACMVLIPY